MPPNAHIFDLDPAALDVLATQWGMPTYRSRQVLHAVYQRMVADPRQMTDLSQHDRAFLSGRLRILTGRAAEHQSASDGVQKLLIDFSSANGRLPVAGDAGNQIECVMIPTPKRRTACISSQIGCPVGCRFCASGIGGLDDNLTAGQIVEQVWQLQRLTGSYPGLDRISHVVFMGMGEPLANLENVVAAVRTLMADWAFGISGRRITISTVGLPAQIRRLADLGLPITLAISLHAPDDELRRQLIPWADYVSIDQLVDAGRYYFDRTGREVTLEYILLHKVNDQPAHARRLVEVARRLRSNVNLIRYNEVKGLAYSRPASADVHRFGQVLKDAGVNTHIRASRGRDIAAACGQLRHDQTTAVN